MNDRPLVIGAGAAGLAVAATLKKHGIECDLVERNQSVGSSWASRYESLHLHTIRWLSDLPFARISRNFGRWVARDDLVRYLNDYAILNKIYPEFGVEVTRIDRESDGWLVTTSKGIWRAEVVVLATSFSNVPHLPEWATQKQTNTVQILHSSSYRNPNSYIGQEVLVVGAGNSATEIAVELAEAGVVVSLAVRTPPNIVRRETFGIPSQLLGILLRRVPERWMNPLSFLLRKFTIPDLSDFGLPAPAGNGFTQFLRTRSVPIVDHGFVEEVLGGRIQIVASVMALQDEKVALTNGAVLTPDSIICATGYRPGLDFMLGHLGVLDEYGTPKVHGNQTWSSAPNLYFAGIELQLGGLLREIGLEAKQIGNAIRTSTSAGHRH